MRAKVSDANAVLTIFQISNRPHGGLLHRSLPPIARMAGSYKGPGRGTRAVARPG
jgi:hypothetical protein